MSRPFCTCRLAAPPVASSLNIEFFVFHIAVVPNTRLCHTSHADHSHTLLALQLRKFAGQVLPLQTTMAVADSSPARAAPDWSGNEKSRAAGPYADTGAY
jgi:hypothetical protein